MPWYISEPEETGWRLDPRLLMQRLQERWPDAKIEEIKNPARKNFSHEWLIRVSDRTLEGRFNQAESGVVLDGDIRDAAIFALWFRSLVPVEQKLIFFDEGYLMHLDLTSSTTEHDLAAAVLR